MDRVDVMDESAHWRKQGFRDLLIETCVAGIRQRRVALNKVGEFGSGCSIARGYGNSLTFEVQW